MDSQYKKLALTEEEKQNALVQGNSVFFSPASSTGSSTLEYSIRTTGLSSLDINNSSGQEEGAVTFNQLGFFTFESNTNNENDRWLIDCKFGPHSEGIIPLLFVKVSGVFPNPYTGFELINTETGIYTHDTPFAEFGDSTQIDIQAVHPDTRDPFAEGFSLIFARFTRIRA